ncbi:MAG: bifunctional glycosyltransferase family 2/GtrA family protein [Ignavibacteriales bacterium]|nr:MAG: bifunctional glycosyltransferase family 2/GtrA family protein [Ignavibacteriales bacterium]
MNKRTPILSIIVPIYNEEKTLSLCIDKVRKIEDENLRLEIILVDDCSTDNSLVEAKAIEKKYGNIKLVSHTTNQGKGAAIRTGIAHTSGDFVAIQDADLEYDPNELKKLIVPLVNDEADVVLGSRYLTGDLHRVLYFWHTQGNRLLTFLSNMFTDLNLTDMETCYKVFRAEVIKSIEIEENRFGFEPEIIAKISQMRVRIFEMGISYRGRTYEEGKKIGFKDAIRTLYCILHYNGHSAPIPLQFMIYVVLGGIAALVNLFVFISLYSINLPVEYAAPIAFAAGAIVNYLLIIALLFRHKARWSTPVELLLYTLIVALVGLFDLGITITLIESGISPQLSKIIASILGVLLNFSARRFIVFPEPTPGPWKPQNPFVTKGQ